MRIARRRLHATTNFPDVLARGLLVGGSPALARGAGWRAMPKKKSPRCELHAARPQLFFRAERTRPACPSRAHLPHLWCAPALAPTAQ